MIADATLMSLRARAWGLDEASTVQDQICFHWRRAVRDELES
jgi:hypothetical protein